MMISETFVDAQIPKILAFILVLWPIFIRLLLSFFTWRILCFLWLDSTTGWFWSALVMWENIPQTVVLDMVLQNLKSNMNCKFSNQAVAIGV